MIYFLFPTLAKSVIEAQEEVHLHQLGIKSCANSLLGIELKNWNEKKIALDCRNSKKTSPSICNESE